MRYDDWPVRLDQFLESRRMAPFQYGAHDCCLFAADAICAMTGIDPAVRFRNSYSSARGALRLMRGMTVGEFAAKVFTCFGYPEVEPSFARRGDVVLLELGAGETIGIVGLDSGPVAASESGWLVTTRERVRRAWRV